MSQRASKTPPPINLLMKAALETWCHQLLYVRRVYPSATFCDSYFLGIRYKAHRHPGVVEYISKAVEVAVPALIGRVADEFCLEVVEEQEEENDAERERKKLNPLLLSSESQSTPSHSQEPLAKKRRSSSNNSDNNIEPAALFGHESTQQSMSSLSTTAPLAKTKGRDSQESNISGENESTPMEELKPPPEEEEEQEQDPVALAYRSLQVLEKFSLYFAPSNNTEDETAAIGDMEDLLGQPKKAPLFTGRRRSGKQKGPTPEELQEKAVVAELERGFRNLILNVSSLKRDRVLPSDSLTFKLVLHVNHRQQICPQIEKALESGSWYPSSAETQALEAQHRPHAPLYEVVVSDWDIKFHMQRQPSIQK